MFLWRFRVLIFYFFIGLVSIIFYPIMLIVSLISNYSTVYMFGKFYAKIFIYSMQWICNIGFQVKSMEQLPQQPYVILPNHQSFWDNFITTVIFPQQSWIIKKELFDIFVIGHGLRLLRPIAIDRTNSNSAKEIIDKGLEQIRKGKCVVIFPEGTRLQTNENKVFKRSGVKLAQEASVPIVPVAHNAGLFWPARSFWFRQSGVIQIIIGNPIIPEFHKNMDTKELNEIVQKWVTDTKNSLL